LGSGGDGAGIVDDGAAAAHDGDGDGDGDGDSDGDGDEIEIENETKTTTRQRLARQRTLREEVGTGRGRCARPSATTDARPSEAAETNSAASTPSSAVRSIPATISPTPRWAANSRALFSSVTAAAASVAVSIFEPGRAPGGSHSGRHDGFLATASAHVGGRRVRRAYARSFACSGRPRSASLRRRVAATACAGWPSGGPSSAVRAR